MNTRLFSIFLLALAVILPVKAERLDSIYLELDQAIDDYQSFVHSREDRIADLTKDIERSKSDDARLEFYHRLYDEYADFDVSKSMDCLNEMLKLSEKTGNFERTNIIYTMLAYQSSVGGYYNESLVWLSKVDTVKMSKELAENYYFTMTHVYGEMGAYATNKEIRQEYYKISGANREKYYLFADKQSLHYYQRRLTQLLADKKNEEAMELCRLWKAKTTVGSHEYSIMAYYMSECYKNENNEKERQYWLALSALYDCKNAVMNQASLWTLASMLSKEGNMDRSQKYVEYSWMCTTKFGGHMRSWQVSPIVTDINNRYHEVITKNNRRLAIAFAVVSILGIFVLCLLFFAWNRNRQLSAARNQLGSINEELEKLNHQLNESNEMMSQVNRQLNDSNRVKDEYIARFLSLCSEYIDKLDNYRLRINRRLKANQYKELVNMTGSSELREEETKKLFANFDAVFLKLYPTFVESFNNLLLPQYHQELGPNSELTTDMRMAALIRLGIDDSAHIAEFMRLSPNTVYNYRARLKSRSSVGRNEFEDKIKEIGL